MQPSHTWAWGGEILGPFYPPTPPPIFWREKFERKKIKNQISFFHTFGILTTKMTTKMYTKLASIEINDLMI
jgi:hypothetical protein